MPTSEAVERAESSAQLKTLLAASLQQVAKRAELKAHEIPRDFMIETGLFSAENGLLSEIRKLLRPRLRDCYGARLEELYRELTAKTGRG